MRKNFSTGAPWESKVGYSRAVRIGNIVEVSGTVSVLDGKVHGENDPDKQAQRIFQIIGEALTHFDLTFADVIRTRIYVTDLKGSWEAIGRVHGEIFKDIRPATSMVEVSALIAPEYLVEIEATAVIAEVA